MNKQARDKYWSIHKRRMEMFEKMFVPKVYKAIRPQLDQFIEILKREGVEAAQRWLHKQIMTDGLMEVLMNMYKVVGVYFANATLTEIRQSAKGAEQKRFGFNDEWVNAIINYFKSHLLDMVFNIAETTKQRIFDLLVKANTEGWGVDKIAMTLESPEMTLIRSRLIVRTESVKAMRFGNDLAEKKSLWVTDKVWIAAHDHRTRHSHRDIDGETTRGKFRVERFRNNILVGYDMMDGPGDKDASIENLANCRCTDARRAARDERGRLIRKQQNELV